MNPGRAKFLGVYILSVGILQLALCLFVVLSLGWDEPFSYFDPQGGIFFVAVYFLGIESAAINFLSWASAFLHLAIGWFWVKRRPLVMTYVISEVALIVPSVFFLLFLLLTKLDSDSAQYTSAAGLFFLIMTIFVFSVIPLVLVLWWRREEDTVVPLNLGRA
jgi:hypothetical protein